MKFSAPQKTRAIQKQSEKQLKLEFNPPACFDQLLFSRFLFAPPVFTPVADYISLTVCVCVLRSLSHSGRENAALSLSLTLSRAAREKRTKRDDESEMKTLPLASSDTEGMNR